MNPAKFRCGRRFHLVTCARWSVAQRRRRTTPAHALRPRDRAEHPGRTVYRGVQGAATDDCLSS